MTNQHSAEQGNTETNGDQWAADTGEEAPESASGADPAQENGAGAPADDGSSDEATGAAAPADSDPGEAAGEAAESLEDRVARLEQELEQARAEAEDYWGRLVRAEADKENIRKRAEKDVDTARKQSLEKLANELLGVRDSLEMGVQAAQQEDADVAKVREGTELTLRMLTQAMEKFSIEEINPEGEKFNPDLHQAMSMQEVEGYEANTVISVMQKGYRLSDRLLRPALVMVAK